MSTVEREACVGLAFMHARQHEKLGPVTAYVWAKEHWIEFLMEVETETGKMLLRMARSRRAIE